MKLYICMGIMTLACVVSFFAGKSVGTEQAQEVVAEYVTQIESEEAAETVEKESVSTSGEMENMAETVTDNTTEETIVIEETVSDGDADNQSPLFSTEDKEKIILVNKVNKLPEDYEVILKKLPDGTNQAAEEAYQPMCDMLSAARADGMILEVCSSYRSMKRQKQLFEEDMHALVSQGYSYLDAYDKVAKYTMPPGYSEHATGLAFDIVAMDYQMLNSKQETTEENQWLREHCAEFGFILRYPKDKEDITGISYESWHFRYVGVEIAKYIMEQGITLEEFLAE